MNSHSSSFFFPLRLNKEPGIPSAGWIEFEMRRIVRFVEFIEQLLFSLFIEEVVMKNVDVYLSTTVVKKMIYVLF
jgi:hypothetical protein